MRVPAFQRRAGVVFNMTPMIDVVFLLIIFFLVSSHLARQEVQLDLELPTADSGHEPADDRGNRVNINVLPEGRILLAGDEVKSEELTRKLRFEQTRSDHDLEVRIRSDRNVPYRFVEPILIACARAEIWNVNFSVTWRDGL